MALRVAVDFGTSSTCIAVSVNGRVPEVVAIDGRPVMSSAVYSATDGTLFVGLEAERQAAVDPSRFEPNPKRRIDEPELLLGNSVVAVRDVVRAVLTRADRLHTLSPVPTMTVANCGDGKSQGVRDSSATVAGSRPIDFW